MIAKKKVKKLSQVLVRRLPRTAAARFTLNIKARNSENIGPVPGIIPENIPKPTPMAIFCGLSFVLKSLL